MINSLRDGPKEKPEVYRLPTAKLLASAISGGVVTTTMEISREDYLCYPIAPGALWEINTHVSVFLLHQLMARKGSRLVFETYQPELPLPRVGDTYEFCSWWIPDAMSAVRDISATWVRATYPDDGNHDHCLLTYETIAAYTGQKEGYRSSHGWITVQAYREFIEQDRLRVRSNWRSIERSVQPTA